jgi:hypothetical protein
MRVPPAAVLAAFLLAVPADAHGQYSGAVAAGSFLPLGAVAEVNDAGLGVEGRVAQEALDVLAIQLSAGLGRFGGSASAFGRLPALFVAPVTLSAKLHTRLGRGVRGYVVAGGGVQFSWNQSSETLAASLRAAGEPVDGTDALVSLGAGLEVGPLVVEARYLTTSANRYVPVTLGYRF